MIALKSDLVIGCWKHMARKYRTVVVPKAGAEEMQAVAAALALMGIMDAKAFLSKYTTTVGNRIYVPFEIGNDDEYPLYAQLATCVHEHVHVRQFRDDPPVFIMGYCLDSSRRTLLECEAYRASMEMAFWITDRCPSPAKTAAQLRDYACTDKDIKVATTYLRAAASVIKKGGVVTPESKVALAWLSSQRLRSLGLRSRG